MMRRPLLAAIGVGTALQVAMVVAGHFAPAIAALFAPVGMGISLFAGWMYGGPARAAWPQTLSGGAIAGGLCALIGIAISFAMGDVTATILALGTLSSAVTGVIGATVGKLLQRKPATA